jgi:hypothetical protein
MTDRHVSPGLLARYAASDALEADVVWALEAHLETCAVCRTRLGAVAGPDTTDLLERVRIGLDAEVARSVRMPARRRALPALWLPPALLPRLLMTVLVVLAAVLLDLLTAVTPGLVLMVAPVAPLLGVAAAWSRGLDAAHELVQASPRAGLYLVLRRTLSVLVVVIPLLAVAGWLVGTSPARFLLPCLAFTAGALALGEVIGLHRAASGLALLWVAAVIAPSVITDRLPVVLAPASLPVWAGITAAVAAVLLIKRDTYTELPSSR